MIFKTAISFVMAIFIASAASGCISSGTAGSNDALAKCLTSKGVKMYGAYWCPHCQNQEKMFGSSFRYITYVECDPEGANANVTACRDAGIQGYPTWIINSAQYPGEQSLSTLAQLAGC